MMQGEGEVKIFNRLLHPLPGSSPQHSYAVVGGDSDLYLMALSLRPSMDNLWIVPEVLLDPFLRALHPLVLPPHSPSNFI